jgi:L-threonate 2-dehydrogenase
MSYVVTVMGTGAMGSAIGRRLRENGATVLTSLAGRSGEARARAESSGMEDVDDSRLVTADFILSIVPPSEALNVAKRLAPALRHVDPKPVFIDCNAVSARTAILIGDVIATSGTPYVDAGIIGSPPKPGDPSPAFFVSGPSAADVLELRGLGLDLKDLDAPLGAASALKMSYAGITKGLLGLASAMILAANRAGAGHALREELERSQPMLLSRFTKSVPDMCPKAYRWVAEMQEIATFAGDDEATKAIYQGFALLFERLAADYAGEHAEIAVLDGFLNSPS